MPPASLRTLLRGIALAAALAGIAGTLLAQEMPYRPTLEEIAAIEGREAELEHLVTSLRSRPEADRPAESLICDAEVFLRLSRFGREMTGYPSAAAYRAALRGLDTGIERARQLLAGRSPWVDQPGRTLRGFRSRIDGTIQPYGLSLPEGWDPRRPIRLDIDLHGRGPTELTFLNTHLPANPTVSREPFVTLFPYGRGNNGWRWAGETDVFEALAEVTRQYRIDPRRIILRGFSMGGHGAWHLGLHYPDRWAAVNPGAGFTETRRYGRYTDPVPPYVEAGWHVYDAVDYARNGFNTPFIAYGGELDPQLAAARNMEAAMAKEGIALRVVVGPMTGHAIHPESRREIMAWLADKVLDPEPPHVKFVTYTLKYSRNRWVEVIGLGAHYRRATVDARLDRDRLVVRTENVVRLRLSPSRLPAACEIDGQTLAIPPGTAPLTLRRAGREWRREAAPDGGARSRKRPGVQGPIDDAFTGPFLCVRPTGEPWSRPLHEWALRRLEQFRGDWRFGFRGEVPVRDDHAIGPAEVRSYHLVLFGDPGSNRVLRRILDRLPLRWTREAIEVGSHRFSTASHAPVLIFPNPLAPDRYVVVNSGHTFSRRDIEGSNVHLTPRLGDWAVLRLGDNLPEIAGFFDEQWRLPAEVRQPASLGRNAGGVR